VNELAQYDIALDRGLGDGYQTVSTQYIRSFYWLGKGRGIAVQVTSRQQDTPPPDDFHLATDFIRMFETNHPDSTNTPPTLERIDEKIINEGSLLTFTVTASDPDIPIQTLTFSLGDEAPLGASIDPTAGVFTWTPSEPQGPSTNQITIRVSDGLISTSETMKIVVDELNTAPVLSAIGNHTVSEGSLLSFIIKASDPDLPTQLLGYDLMSAPVGAAIEKTSGLFT
jgi:hypothetical protein